MNATKWFIFVWFFCVCFVLFWVKEKYNRIPFEEIHKNYKDREVGQLYSRFERCLSSFFILLLTIVYRHFLKLDLDKIPKTTILIILRHKVKVKREIRNEKLGGTVLRANDWLLLCFVICKRQDSFLSFFISKNHTLRYL